MVACSLPFCPHGNNDSNPGRLHNANKKPPGAESPGGLDNYRSPGHIGRAGYIYQAEPLMFSGENGRVRQRMPLAAKIALPMAG